MAHFDDKKSFESYDFNTDLIGDNAEAIQTGLEIIAPIPGVSKLKLAKWAANPKWLTFLSKDAKYKKSLAAMKKLKETNKRVTAGWKQLTEAQSKAYQKQVAKIEDELRKYSSKASTKYNKTPDWKINKVEDIFEKDNKAFDKIINPKGPNILQRNPKKIIAWVWAVWLGWNEILSTWNEDAETTEEIESSEPSNNETIWNENNSGEDIVPTDDGSTIEEEQETTDAVNNEGASTPAASWPWVLVGDTNDKQGKSYKLYFKGGAIVGVGPSWNSVTLATGVNNWNKRFKVQEAASKVLAL